MPSARHCCSAPSHGSLQQVPFAQIIDWQSAFVSQLDPLGCGVRVCCGVGVAVGVRVAVEV